MKAEKVRKPKARDLERLPPDLCLETRAEVQQFNGVVECLQWNFLPERDIGRRTKSVVVFLWFWPENRTFTGVISYQDVMVDLDEALVLRSLLPPAERARSVALSITRHA